jgi:hypothetical protein
MSDTYSSLFVILSEDVSEEEAQRITEAIKMIKGVLDVKANPRDAVAESIASTRIRADLANKLFNVIWEK